MESIKINGRMTVAELQHRWLKTKTKQGVTEKHYLHLMF